MIATGLTFLFGFFAALLLALLLSPIIWRRSRRIARREFEATIPASANEIRASFDHVRAEAALTSRRREMKARAVEERAFAERAEAGRVFSENAGLRERNEFLEHRLARQEAVIEETAATIEGYGEEIGRLEDELQETRHDVALRRQEMEALGARFRDLEAIADERKRTVARLEAGDEPGADETPDTAHRIAERWQPTAHDGAGTASLETLLAKERAGTQRRETLIAELTAQLAARDEALVRAFGDKTAPGAGEAIAAPNAGEAAPADVPAVSAPPAAVARAKIDPSDLMVDFARLDENGLRERIAEVAALVIHRTALAEGPNSAVEQILAKVPPEAEGATTSTLAGRVLRLREAGKAIPEPGEAAR